MDPTCGNKRAQDLLGWFATNGGSIHPGLDIRKGPMGCGLFMNDDYRGLDEPMLDNKQKGARETELVSCPHDLTLSILNVPKVAPWWRQEVIDEFDTEVTTRFMLIEMYLQGQESFWAPYINMLPQPNEKRPFHTPMYWTKDEILWMKGTNLEGAVLTRREHWQMQFAAFKDRLEHFCPDQQKRSQKYTWNLYLWAATVFTSRCFPHWMLKDKAISRTHPDFPEPCHFMRTRIAERWRKNDPSLAFPVLLPVLDLANHSPTNQAVWHNYGAICRLTTLSPLKGGAEVFNNYGSKSNEQLIMGYGFALSRNPFDAFGLALSSAGMDKIDFITRVRESYMDRTTRGSAQFDLSETDSIATARLVSLNSRIHHIRATHDPETSTATTPLSVILANARELQALASSPVSTSSMLRQSSRLVALVAVQLYLKLKSAHAAITVHDAELPIASPDTEAGRIAEFYRHEQLDILHQAAKRLESTIQRRFDRGNAVDLSDILTQGPREMVGAFRNVVHKACKTRQARKLRDEGLEELAWVIWVCTVWTMLDDIEALAVASDRLDEGVVSRKRLATWTRMVKNAYGSPHVDPSAHKVGAANSDPLKDNNSIANEARDHSWTIQDEIDATETTLSYLAVLRDVSVVGKLKTWDKEIVQWALRVVREEGVLCPVRLLNDAGDADDEEGEGDATREDEMRFVILIGAD